MIHVGDSDFVCTDNRGGIGSNVSRWFAFVVLAWRARREMYRSNYAACMILHSVDARA